TRRSSDLNNGRVDEDADGRTIPFPSSARDRIPRLQRRAGPRGPSGVRAPAGAAFSASRKSDEATSPPRDEEPRTAWNPQNFRNVAMISPSVLREAIVT